MFSFFRSAPQKYHFMSPGLLLRSSMLIWYSPLICNGLLLFKSFESFVFILSGYTFHYNVSHWGLLPFIFWHLRKSFKTESLELFFFLISETFSKSFLQIFPPLYWSFSFPSEIPMIWFLAHNITFFFVFTIYLCLSFLQSTLFWYFNLLACSFYPFYSQSLFHLFF